LSCMHGQILAINEFGMIFNRRLGILQTCRWNNLFLCCRYLSKILHAAHSSSPVVSSFPSEPHPRSILASNCDNRSKTVATPSPACAAE
jgi:hypothetical protein